MTFPYSVPAVAHDHDTAFTEEKKKFPDDVEVFAQGTLKAHKAPLLLPRNYFNLTNSESKLLLVVNDGESGEGCRPAASI